MAIRFNLADVLRPGQLATLRSILGCNTAADLDAAVTKLAKALVAEFGDIVLGLYTPRSGSDVAERRLLHMVGFYFDGKVPSELSLSQLFRITESNASALLRNLSARNRTALLPAYRDTLQDIFNAKTANINGAHEVTLISKHLVEWLKGESSRVAPNYGQIYKVRGTNDRYGIPIDTYDAICTALSITP